jgi:CAAX protease family protein
LPDIEPQNELPPQPPFPPEKTEGIVSWIFLDNAGLRGIWRLALYACVTAILGFSELIFLQLAVGPPPGRFNLGYWFPYEVLSFAAVFGAALVMAKIEARPAGVYGLPRKGAFGKLFWQGCAIGFVEVGGLVGLIYIFGGYSFGEIELRGIEALRWALVWALLFLFVGLFEEFLFRGYTQFTLAEMVGFWPAAILLSLLFGAVHRDNLGETWAGIAGVALTGMVFAFGLRRTGNLWLVVGWHAAFDFGETYLFSVPNSGTVFRGHLSDATLHGPEWLTGGTAGPEASVFSFVMLGVLTLAVHVLFPAKKKETPPN